ncbi:unnamed protein product, partial [Symbiodinium pilosum]
ELKPFFSPGEPAVNRYMTGGGIAPHIDREAVTLNVVLSEPGAFAGGGTAFWPQEKVEGETDEACAEKFDMRDAAVLRPRQGTAILFNGSIAHAGRPVISGVRHAFVKCADVWLWTRWPASTSSASKNEKERKAL